jgi:hypothetical protein
MEEIFDPVPQCFRPVLVLKDVIKYQNLSEVSFSRDQKQFICEEIDRVHSFLAWTNKTGADRVTDAGLADRFFIKRRTIRSWLMKYNSRLDKFYNDFQDDVGHPFDIDDEEIEKVREKIREGKKTTKTVNDGISVIKLLKVAKFNTGKKRGNARFDAIDPNHQSQIVDLVHLDSRTIATYKTNHKMVSRKATHLPKYRLQAERQFRRWYKHCAIVFAFAGYLHAENKWNADATGAKVTLNEKGQMVLTLLDDGAEQENVVSSTTVHDLDIFIKWMHMGSAAGESADPVFIIAVDKMPEGEFFYRSVKKMGNSMNTGSVGHLYICKKRAGTASMWRHWFLNVVIPTIKKTRDYYDFKVYYYYFKVYYDE